jgi:uncharacterized protein YecE (DUF72 family)
VITREAARRDTWVIFDNTAAGQALGNALDLQTLCSGTSKVRSNPKRKAQPKPRLTKT